MACDLDGFPMLSTCIPLLVSCHVQCQNAKANLLFEKKYNDDNSNVPITNTGTTGCVMMMMMMMMMMVMMMTNHRINANLLI
jgi:hypothetical protein